MSAIKEKLSAGKDYLKNYWSEPAPNNYLSVKEKVAYGGAQIGTFIFSTVVAYMTFTPNWFCGAIVGIDYADFAKITIFTSIINYFFMFLSPFSILIFENHGVLEKKTKISANLAFISELIVGIALYFAPIDLLENVPQFGMVALPQILANLLVLNAITNYVTWFVRRKWCGKYGRMKPIIIAFGIPAAVLMSVIPFIDFNSMQYAYQVVVLHFLFSLLAVFTAQFCNIQGLVQFISPNSEERQTMYSIVPIITGLVPSVISLFFPVLIGTTGGFTELLTYKIFVPIFAITGVVITIICMLQVKERIIEKPNENTQKVKFFKGVKNVLINPHLWIINFSNLFGVWTVLFSQILQWWFVYSIRLESWFGVASNVIVLSMTAGNLLTPFLIKKFEKGTILVWARIFSLLCVGLMYWAINMSSITVGLVVFMLAALLKNLFSPIETGLLAGVTSDALDYHQWKYGERADNMMSIFGMLLAPVTMLLNLILPKLLNNIGFSSDWDLLYNPQVIAGVFNVYVILTSIGILCSTVPFFFYKLTKEQHAQCIKEMQDRVGEVSFHAGQEVHETAEI